MVFLEINYHMSSLPKSTALALLCYLHQAERSVHFALSSPSQWPEFVAYYDDFKRGQIGQLVRTLKATETTPAGIPNLQLTPHDTVLDIVRFAASAVCNQFKKHWSFSPQEISFFCRTLERVISALHADSAHGENLVGLRTDCYECQYVIARRLIGVSAVRKALAVEHFGQSDYMNHIKIGDLLSSKQAL
jgi:hypothetical protein